MAKLAEEEPRWMAHRVLDPKQPYHLGVTALMQENRTGVTLLPRDVAVYLSVLERTDPLTGHCNYTQAALASEIGMDPKYLGKSISRLKGAYVLTNMYDPVNGQRWFLLNPALVWCGSAGKRWSLEQQWKAAWDRVMAPGEDEELLEKVKAHNRKVDAVANLKAA